MHLHGLCMGYWCNWVDEPILVARPTLWLTFEFYHRMKKTLKGYTAEYRDIFFQFTDFNFGSWRVCLEWNLLSWTLKLQSLLAQRLKKLVKSNPSILNCNTFYIYCANGLLRYLFEKDCSRSCRPCCDLWKLRFHRVEAVM